MKTSLRLCTVALLGSVHLSSCHRRKFLNVNSRTARSAGVLVSDHLGNDVGSGKDKGTVGLEATLGSLVADFIEGKGPGLKSIIKTGNKIDINDAVRQLSGKLPEDVSSLLRMTSAGGAQSSKGALSEDSMQKARGILNNMMVQAWSELDDVVFECKEFTERNRGTYEQVVADLARLGSQLSNLAELRVSASQGITDQDNARKEAEKEEGTLTQNFKVKRFENSQEMSIRKNDLAVFDFILNATRCKDGAALVQTNGAAASPLQICSTKDGLELHFDDHELQAKVERLMTADARKALREALGQIPAAMSLLGVSRAANTTGTTTALPTYAAEVVPVAEEPAAGGQWKKCVDGKPNCGLLHDLMSIEWGKFRDSFDELTAEMKANQEAYDISKQNILDQMTVINDEKTKHMESLADTISHINADTEEMGEKDEQKRHLTKEFDTTCAEFRAKITEILFTRICAVRKVRNELLAHSTLTPPSNLTDCDVSDWESKTGECFSPSGSAILCDDSCPNADPYKCGGSETMKRDVIAAPDSNGMICPRLERQKKCAQKKCPVDCVVSAWSGWSKCTKDCEGGVQSKSRSVLVKAKNGGSMCDVVQEERSCNTGSCDRDCKLDAWTEWAPCSMACGGGITTRSRKVLVPIRGQGKCPTKTSADRFGEKTCNTRECVGDEFCIAKQDLILAIDASGSLKEDGFEILRNFAGNLTLRYESEYFGNEAMRVGIVLFGNGNLLTLPDGTTSISTAINIQPLTGDMNLVRSKISGLKWQRGFTNMAQAFTLADTMLSQGGRTSAQSAVLVLSDGKYSFKYQTAQKAQELKDKSVQIFMAPIVDFEGEELKTLQKWSSQPWETNYERVPGLKALEFNSAVFVEKLLVKFCPDSLSPSIQRAVEEQKQYMLIHEQGWPSDDCGAWYYVGKVGAKDDCAAAARAKKHAGFAFGNGLADGKCYSEAIEVTQQFWDEFKANRTNPPCTKGRWLFNPFFDTYAINPATM